MSKAKAKANPAPVTPPPEADPAAAERKALYDYQRGYMDGRASEQGIWRARVEALCKRLQQVFIIESKLSGEDAIRYAYKALLSLTDRASE